MTDFEQREETEELLFLSLESWLETQDTHRGRLHLLLGDAAARHAPFVLQQPDQLLNLAKDGGS